MLVAPPAGEVQEGDGVGTVVGSEALGGGIVRVRVRVQRRIPEDAAVGVVDERADDGVEVGDCVVVRTWSGVVGVRAHGDVDDGADAVVVFLDRAVLKRLAVGVLAVVDALGAAVGEAHHGVLPVADVVAELEAWVVQHPVASVVRVVVEIKGVHDVVGLGHRDDHAGSCAVDGPVTRRSCALEPAGECSDPFVRSQEDVRPTVCECIETV